MEFDLDSKILHYMLEDEWESVGCVNLESKAEKAAAPCWRDV